MINVVETGVIFIILFPLLQVNQLTNNPVYGMDEVSFLGLCIVPKQRYRKKRSISMDTSYGENRLIFFSE